MSLLTFLWHPFPSCVFFFVSMFWGISKIFQPPFLVTKLTEKKSRCFSWTLWPFYCEHRLDWLGLPRNLASLAECRSSSWSDGMGSKNFRTHREPWFFGRFSGWWFHSHIFWNFSPRILGKMIQILRIFLAQPPTSFDWMISCCQLGGSCGTMHSKSPYYRYTRGCLTLFFFFLCVWSNIYTQSRWLWFVFSMICLFFCYAILVVVMSLVSIA